MVAIPESDRVEMHDRGLAVPRYRDLYPAAAAVAAASEADHRLAVLVDHMAAGAAAVEIAGLVLELDADLVGIGDWFVRLGLRGQKQLHRADLLLRVLCEVPGIVAAHEAGGRLLSNRAAEHFCVKGLGLRRRNVAIGIGGEGEGQRRKKRQGSKDFHGSTRNVRFRGVSRCQSPSRSTAWRGFINA